MKIMQRRMKSNKNIRYFSGDVETCMKPKDVDQVNKLNRVVSMREDEQIDSGRLKNDKCHDHWTST